MGITDRVRKAVTFQFAMTSAIIAILATDILNQGGPVTDSYALDLLWMAFLALCYFIERRFQQIDKIIEGKPGQSGLDPITT